MSSIVYPKKRIPISVSLGIANKLTTTETINDEMFSAFSYEKLEALLFNTNTMAFICQDNNYQKSKQNELLVFLAVRRAYGLKNHTKLPVMIVVKSHKIGKQVADELARHTTDYKLFNMIFTIKDKINKDLLVKTSTKADFILLTYTQLRDLVYKKAYPAIDQIVYLNPLSKYNSHRESIILDNIKDGLHRHKCRKVKFTYIINAKSFLLLQKKDYQYILSADDCLFFGCNEKPLSLLSNEFNSVLPHLSDEHFQFFVLRELFRKRGGLTELVERFKKTITYKLHLYSYNLTSQNLKKDEEGILSCKMIERKAEIDKKVKGKINKMLLLFKKKTTKTIIGEEIPDFEQNKVNYSWNEPIETAPFLPLIEKKKDKYYYLTGLGEAVLIASSNYAGVEVNFSSFLNRMANILFNNNRFLSKLSIEEILEFYSMLIGCDPVELPPAIKECLATDGCQSEGKLSTLINEFIFREFGYIMNDYSNHAALTLLDPFKEFMDENALYFIKRLKHLKSKKKKAIEVNLPDAILKAVKYKPLMIGEVSQKVKVDYKKTGKELKKLEKKGHVKSIKIIQNDGSTRLKYCQPGVLAKYPHLKKTCGICVLYRKRFRKCPLLELLAIFDQTAFPTDCLDYLFNYIRDNATSCENVVEYSDLVVEGEKIRYTINKEELEREMEIIEGSFVLGQEVQTKYACMNCKTIIEEFGTGGELFFPRRRVLCPNCATGYYKKSEQLILIQTEYRNVLRSIYYKLTGSVPKILQELRPSYAYVIYDYEYANVDMLKNQTLVLEICNHKVPLEEVKNIYFMGEQHVELEEFLTHLAKERSEKYSFTVNRSQQKEQNEIIEACEPFSQKQYQLLHKLIAYISDKEILNNAILKSRNLSNIGGLLEYQRFAQEKNQCSSKINKQLYEMTDLFMIVQTGVKSSYYGRQLEGLNQDCFFDLLKEEGRKVGLWTHGRVVSRLVKDLFLSSTIKTSNARAPLDALINQILRQFRFVVNKVFRKVGFEPSSMGPGLLHRRKTKSDIDKKGFYFDIIEPIGPLALASLLKALFDDLFSEDDCSLELDGSGQEVYKVKNSSLEKIEKLVEEALAEPVYYKGKELSFLKAFEENLLSFRQAIQLCFVKLEKDNTISSKEITHCINSAGYYPFVYCPVECKEDLKKIYDFTAKNASFFEGREERVLAAREKRSDFRAEAMKKWLASNGERGKKKLKLTKHQAKEQERSLLIVLMLINYGIQMNGFFGFYSTSQIREILHLTQNQVQRILKQMVTRGFLVKMKYKMQNFYQLNLENETVHEMLFTIGKIPCDDADRTLELMSNSRNVLSCVEKLLMKIQDCREGLPLTIGWSGWKIPSNIEQIIEVISE
ncbi:MAG: hypothetical protein GPJ52_03120 [Candidatus Heimdallarchaeota archaeon]|nr:hypothetical protein [Candidatus Heimdallarchaeota archaeon]